MATMTTPPRSDLPVTVETIAWTIREYDLEELEIFAIAAELLERFEIRRRS